MVNWYLERGGDNDDDDEVDGGDGNGNQEGGYVALWREERLGTMGTKTRYREEEKNKEVKGGEQKNVMVVNIWRVE